jgi:hypothetical protein
MVDQTNRHPNFYRVFGREEQAAAPCPKRRTTTRMRGGENDIENSFHISNWSEILLTS